MSLVKHWIDLRMRSGESITEIACNLSSRKKMTITTSRLREWESGSRGLPKKIHNHMLEEVLSNELSQYPDHADRLYRILELP